MGGPMASNLAASGQFDVVGFDVDLTRAKALSVDGVRTADSLLDAIKGAAFVMTSLPGPAQIEAVAFESGLVEAINDSTIWIDLSTNNLATCRKIEEAASRLGFGYLDAPVSGGDEGARAGTLTVLAGGTKEVFRKSLPLLETIGRQITHLGPNGAGYSAKISQVVLCYLHSLALSEAMVLGVKGGVAPDQMLSIIRNSTGKSYVSDRYGPPIVNGDYDSSFTLGLAHKDMRLAQEMAEEFGIRLPMCELTTRTYAEAIEAFGFDANHLKAVRLLEQNTNTYLQK